VSFNTVLFDVGDDHVATITLNRPDQLNSFTEEMAAEMTTIWTTIRDTDDIHAAVLRAAGDRAFCTGIDIKSGRWWGDLNIWNQTDPVTGLSSRQRRSSLWMREGDGFVLRFHQSTPLAPGHGDPG